MSGVPSLNRVFRGSEAAALTARADRSCPLPGRWFGVSHTQTLTVL